MLMDGEGGGVVVDRRRTMWVELVLVVLVEVVKH